MDTSILEDLGLTGAEIKVFIALLELGSSTAGAVVERSGLQNAVVHRAFHSLIEKGLISYVFEGKIKHYHAIEPKMLLSFLDEKKAKLEKILPELEARTNNQKEKPKARIFQGIRGVKEMIYLMIESKTKEWIGYGGASVSHNLLGDFFWENFHKRRISKKIKAKLIFHHSLKWWGDTLNKKYSMTEVRFTNQDFEELTETIICGGQIAIIIYFEKPFGFLIDEQLVARSYTKFFEFLWKSARK